MKRYLFFISLFFSITHAYAQKQGQAYQAQKYPQSLAYEFKALKMAEETGSQNDLVQAQGNIGQIYLVIAKDTTGTIKADSLIPAGKIANLHKAVDYLSRSVAVSKKIGDLNVVLTSSLSLSEAQAMMGNYKDAFENYKQYATLRDSIFSIDNNKKMAASETKHDAELIAMQIEVQRLQIIAARNERKYYIAALGILVLLAVGIYSRFRAKGRNWKEQEEDNHIVTEEENADMLHLRTERSEAPTQSLPEKKEDEIVEEPSVEKQDEIPATDTTEEETTTVTDLTYLRKFCEEDEERMKKFIRIFITAVPVFADKIKTSLEINDLTEIAMQVHAFKPKWMMMGMGQSTELGQKIERLCKEREDDKRIMEHLHLLLEQNDDAAKELEKIV